MFRKKFVSNEILRKLETFTDCNDYFNSTRLKMDNSIVFVVSVRQWINNFKIYTLCLSVYILSVLSLCVSVLLNFCVCFCYVIHHFQFRVYSTRQFAYIQVCTDFLQIVLTGPAICFRGYNFHSRSESGCNIYIY